MKINNFNSKVNLPKFCAKLGYTDYQFVRIPTFGWYAYNKDRTFAANIFDLVKRTEQDQLYSIIANDKPEYLDFDLAYSDLAEKKLKYNLLETQLWSAAASLSRSEMDSYKLTYLGKKQLLRDVLEAHGLTAMAQNNFGVITSEVLEKFSMLPWPTKDIRGKILVPTFCAPNHVCSLEYCSWDNPQELYPLWLNDEKGWYGDIKSKKIISNMGELCTTPGITWDYKADYWFGDDIVDLSETLNIETCLRIWTEAKNTAFSKSPLTQIIESGKTDELKAHVGNLNRTQLDEIEKATGVKLFAYWKQAREHQVQVGDRIFLNRDNMYHVYKKGNLQQITNFTIDVDKIIGKGKKFYRVGTIHFGDQSLPFEMDEKHFSTNHRFQTGLKQKFLESGLGVPIIHPDFASRALLIVDSFNSGVKIEPNTNV